MTLRDRLKVPKFIDFLEKSWFSIEIHWNPLIFLYHPATSPLPAHTGILRKSKEIQQNPSPIGPIGTQMNLLDTTDTSRDLETMRKRLRAVDLPYLYPPCRSRCLLPTPTGPHPAPPGPPVPHTRPTVPAKWPHTGPTSVGTPPPHNTHTHTHTHTHKPNCHPGDGDAKLCGGGVPTARA